MKNATPRFSARPSALAAPKKLDPTMRPRATSSAHSTGALNRKRSNTEPQTTRRSAASRMAAVASLSSISQLMKRWPALSESAAPDMAIPSSLRRADHIHHGFCLGARLHEIVGLRKDALAERLPVAFHHRHALAREQRKRLFLDRKAVGARIGARLPGGIEKSLAQFRLHARERRLAEIRRQWREIMLRQRVVFRGFVEFAGEDGRRIMLEPVEHAGLQRRVDLPERQRRRGGAHQAQALGDDWIGQGSDLQPGQIFRRLDRLLRQHAAGAEIICPRDDPDIGALEQSFLDRLGSACIERHGLLWKAREQIAEVKCPDQWNYIGRDR